MNTPNLNPNNCPDNSTRATRGANVTKNDIRINLGGATLIVVLILASIIGVTGVIIGIDIADRDAKSREEAERLAQYERNEDRRTQELHDALQDLQRQYRMVELKLDDWTVVAHRAGLQLPGDYTRGPQGNMDKDAYKFGTKRGR
jgi:hypothetical protein